ncbi:hypothetical protein, partial [Vibrio cholerae]|uniref:hypothetical protein n=1 Tax=Vibrio cholerae TaxID=666 RepID=UPI001F1D9539
LPFLAKFHDTALAVGLVATGFWPKLTYLFPAKNREMMVRRSRLSLIVCRLNWLTVAFLLS